MFQSVRNRRNRGNAEVQMAPLIDMVFILLIFFLVTTAFVRETGVKVNRPQARTAEALDRKGLLIGIDPNGHVYFEEHRVDLLALRAMVQRRLQVQPNRPVVLIADQGTPTGRLVEVMDECRAAGAESIAVASSKEQ